jgi:hypothetical protein
MKINFPVSTKSRIEKAMKNLVVEMTEEDVPLSVWEEMQKKYKGYGEMLIKKISRIDPNTVLIVSVSIAEVLILAVANSGFDIKQAWTRSVKARV